MLGHKTSLNKFKSEIVSGIFSDPHGTKLKISHRETLQTWRLNNMPLNNCGVKEEKKIPEINENGNATYQNLWDAARTVLRGYFKRTNGYINKKDYK